MKLARGRAFRIGLLLVSPYACDGTVPLGDKGLSASGGSSNPQMGGSSNQGGATFASSGFGGTHAPSGGASTSSTGGTSMVTSANTGGANGSGGASAPATGGASASVRSSTGGALTGGTKSTGGAPATGGSESSGGAAPGGGAATTGGVNGTGGSSGATGGATTVATTSSATPTCVTSTNNSWKSATVATASPGAADVTVIDTVGQTWEGFGGAFNELGWTVLASQTMKDEAMQLLFGTDGAHFTWGRIPMGANDYATSRYTLDDPTGANPTPPSEARPAADVSLSRFAIVNGHDDRNLIPYIKAAKAVNANLRFWASPWTPPIWMKTDYNANQSGKMTGWKPSYFDGGNIAKDASLLTAYAQYYVKFVNAYKDQGISVEVVSPQNEPGYEQNYPSCLWDSATYVSWVKTLGAAMQPLNVKVMLGTLSNNGDIVEGVARKDIDIAKAVLADSTAKGYVSMVGVQWGVLEQVVTDNGLTFGNNVIKVWTTEHKCGNYPWVNGYSNTKPAPNDQAYAVESWGYIRDAINKAKVTSYSAWNMVLDKNGLGIDTSRDWRQDALLVADSGNVYTTQAYYVFRHFSQFVDPGDTVIATNGGDAVAFKRPNGTVIVVMYNSGAAKSNYTVKIGTRSLQFSMPQAGWATVVSP
jgi:glucosylceramidase